MSFGTFPDNISLSGLIQACERNETLYTILDLDSHFKLMNISYLERELFNNLERELDQVLSGDISIAPVKLLSKERVEKIKVLQAICAAMSTDDDPALVSSDFSFDCFP